MVISNFIVFFSLFSFKIHPPSTPLIYSCIVCIKSGIYTLKISFYLPIFRILVNSLENILLVTMGD